MNNGTAPVAPHPKQFSFPRTFGSLATLPDEFNPSTTVLDQMADGLPMGCTAETVRQAVLIEGAVDIDPHAVYDETRKLEGTYPQIVGCDVKDAHKIATTYFNRAPYFEIHPANGLDYFDSLCSSLVVAHQTDGKFHAAGVGTPWLHEFNASNGIPKGYSYDGNPNHYSWHAYNAIGYATIQGERRLKFEPHQGTTFGDGGFVWLNRMQVNKLFDEWGTIALMQLPTNLDDIKKVKLTMIEVAVHYITRLIQLGGYTNAFTDLIRLLKLLNL